MVILKWLISCWSVKPHPETLRLMTEAKDEFKKVSLHLASENDHVEVVDKLLDSVKAYFDTL